MRDEDYGAALTLEGGDDGIWSPPMAASACEQPDWRSLYEQAHTRAEKERARADAAQARAEELRRAEVDSRSRAGSLKWQLDTCRNKLKAASEETKEVRRAAKDALFFQAEVARLEKLLSQAGVESSKRSTIMSLRMEVARLTGQDSHLLGRIDGLPSCLSVYMASSITKLRLAQLKMG